MCLKIQINAGIIVFSGTPTYEEDWNIQEQMKQTETVVEF